MSAFREYTCVVCPNGCALQVEVSEGEKTRCLSVSGNLCPRGRSWAEQEVENPLRTISTNVLVTGGMLPVVSVRTLDAIPLAQIRAVRESLKDIILRAPVKIGDIVSDHPAGIPCRVAATRNVPAV
ncbi:MAG: DUF1667 domain-containing protein [Pyramidobacter sp.]|nr:DUF1667 domain-containing protein [Pyramidobacter sp.]